ncbi:hypothetical protein BROUX41_002374 [Berkeleyomyces rouxiae]|uniref:uncharacterized protein n=1 Tax=Berkeleyomyces rouxiae TaxID=2035830 RepID=UPI003B7B8B2A
MKTAKPSGLSRVFGSIRRKAGSSSSTSQNQVASTQLPSPVGNYPPGSPEAAAIEALSKFCTTDPARTENDIDPAVYLPTIVESCESSPMASAEVAHLIGEFLGKAFQGQEQIQYKAIMILRILIDNQGVTTFVRNLNKSFAANAKIMLRSMKNANACVLLIETLEKLDSLFPRDSSDLPAVVIMWRREKEKDRSGSQYGFALHPQYVQPPLQAYPQQQPFMPPAAQPSPTRRDYFAREHSSRQLPNPVELASRLEEARTSAKLLHQCVSNASQAELLDSDLVAEFTARCVSASKSVQNYIAAEDPSPDDATMENLLATNEMLQKALDSRERAIANAREARDTRAPSPLPAPVAAPVAAPVPSHESAFGSSPESPFIPPTTDAPTPLAPRPAQIDTGLTRQLSGTPQLPPLDTSVPATPTAQQPRGGKFKENPRDLAEPVSALSSDEENPFADPNARQATKGTGSRHDYGIVEDSDDDLYNTTPKRTTQGNSRF